ncbi:MAG: hypothetical protein ABI601_19770 [bacterium]
MSDETADQRDTHGEASEGGSSPLSAVSALMDERRKYESWLEALEAKRGATPERVFTRVHADYSARLDVVLNELVAHSGGLRTELMSLSTQLATLEDEQQQQRDERAEAELRAHVGELSVDAWQSFSTSTDKSLDDLTARHTDLERELTRTRELLTEAERPATPRGAAAVPATPLVPEPASVEAVEARSSEGQDSAARDDVATSEQSAAAPGASGQPVELPASASVAETAMIGQAAHSPTADRGDADVTPQPTQRADATRTSGEVAGAFDELAFLSSVVDTPTGATDVPAPTDRGDERSRRDSFAQRASEADIVNLSADPGTMLEGTAPARNSPLAMNVSGNIPIVIKDKSTEAAKSLKCGECGSMNYPTEWYCERCGAELASL